jgi:hypothetical protein
MSKNITFMDNSMPMIVSGSKYDSEMILVVYSPMRMRLEKRGRLKRRTIGRWLNSPGPAAAEEKRYPGSIEN